MLGRAMSLFMRLALANAAVLAVVTLLLLFSPIEISYPVTDTQAVILVAGFVVTVGLNLLLLRGVIAPLRRLTATMRSIDPMQPGRRLSTRGTDSDVAALTAAFNDMLDRLETERRESGRQALAAQEAERRRIARELHDGVAQELAYIVAESDGPLAAAAERALDESRRAIAALTRPVDEPLEVALVQAAEEVAGRVGVQLKVEVCEGATVSPDEREALIRIVREAITNAGRHGKAANVSVELSNGHGTLLRIADDGTGFDPARTRVGGFGLVSMRERAEALGGRFTLFSEAGSGAKIEVRLP
jgi:two-component system sensor histidine kinase UhpB